MSAKSFFGDQKIGFKRVRVERFIGLGKTYKILLNPMNMSETQLSSDIIFVCFMFSVHVSCLIMYNTHGSF